MERRRNMRLTSQDLATLQASLELGRHLSDTDLSAGHVHELLACLPAAHTESALLSFFARLLNLLRRLAPSGLFDGATGPSIRDLIVRQARAQREKVGKDVWSNDVRRSLGAVLNFVLNAASPNTPAASRASFGSAGISRALADIGGTSARHQIPPPPRLSRPPLPPPPAAAAAGMMQVAAQDAAAPKAAEAADEERACRRRPRAMAAIAREDAARNQVGASEAAGGAGKEGARQEVKCPPRSPHPLKLALPLPAETSGLKVVVEVKETLFAAG